MEEYRYQYKINKDELIEYYQFMIKRTKSFRRIAFWIKLSIPILIVATLLIFKLYPIFYVDVAAAAIFFLWITIGSQWVIRQFLYLRVGDDFLKEIKVKKFEEVELVFADDVFLNGEKISMKDINIIPLTKNLLFTYHENSAFILPLRVLENNEEAGELYRFILTKQKIQLEK